MGERVTSLRAAAGVLLICSLATSVVFAAACCSIYVVFLLKAVFAFIARLILTLGEILVAVVAAIASGTRYKKIAQKCFFGGFFTNICSFSLRWDPMGAKKFKTLLLQIAARSSRVSRSMDPLLFLIVLKLSGLNPTHGQGENGSYF